MSCIQSCSSAHAVPCGSAHAAARKRHSGGTSGGGSATDLLPLRASDVVVAAAARVPKRSSGPRLRCWSKHAGGGQQLRQGAYSRAARAARRDGVPAQARHHTWQAQQRQPAERPARAGRHGGADTPARRRSTQRWPRVRRGACRARLADRPRPPPLPQRAGPLRPDGRRTAAEPDARGNLRSPTRTERSDAAGMRI